MVRSVETIRREIDSLNQATIALAEEFHRLYSGYLGSLGQALRRQVVMATYHLCTQIYPESFLALSVGQREKLQRQIRELGQQADTWLQKLLEPGEPEAPEPGLGEPEDQPEAVELAASQDAAAGADPEEAEDLAPPLAEANRPGEEQVDGPLGEAEAIAESAPSPEPQPKEATDDQNPDLALEGLTLPSMLKSMVLAALASEMAEDFGDRLFKGDDLTPTRLAKQHIFLEQQIRDVLQRVSKQANLLLQAAQVLPNLPEAVLDAASETEVGPGRGRSVPNVLNVLVAMAAGLGDNPEDDQSDEEDGLESDSRPEPAFEDDDDDDDDDDRDDGDDGDREGLMTHLAAINLRLSDVEFADVQASLWRSKLRTALGQLRKLGKHYQKAQREMAIAEAEQAWRAVWYDDSSR